MFYLLYKSIKLLLKLYKVELIEPMGADTLIWTSLESKPLAIRIEGSSELKLHDTLNIGLNIARSSIFDKKSEERL